MNIKHVSVAGFRGIRKLDWPVDGRTVCLIGPGDSTKTTILDAVEYALIPRWTIQFTDYDFYGGTHVNDIDIRVTVGDLSPELRHDDKFGCELRGWHPERGLLDEPEDGTEPVITVRLRVDDALEPTWTVINDRNPDGRTIGWRDRQSLGMTRLGGDVARDLAWARGSALSRLTEDFASASSVLAEAHRAARATVSGANLAQLQKVAAAVQKAASQLGVRCREEYRPLLDARALSISGGTLSLHDAGIPVCSLGLGSRRLAALAIQQGAAKRRAIVLIDEIEHGLEPHRIRRLIQSLTGTSLPVAQVADQVLMTTHSPVVVQELSAENLSVVRSTDDGEISVRQVPDDLQATMRATPEALLGRRTIVCEGKTEVGLCRALEPFWAKRHQDLPLAYHGTVYTEGGGSDAPGRAKALASLGHQVAYFADSDTDITPTEDELRHEGVEMIRWDAHLATEERIARDLPVPALQRLIDLLIEWGHEQSLIDTLNTTLDPTRIEGKDVAIWINVLGNEQRIRQAIGLAAKSKPWFKRIDFAEELGKVVASVLERIPNTDLANKLEQLEAWAYAD